MSRGTSKFWSLSLVSVEGSGNQDIIHNHDLILKRKITLLSYVISPNLQSMRLLMIGMYLAPWWRSTDHDHESLCLRIKFLSYGHVQRLTDRFLYNILYLDWAWAYITRRASQQKQNQLFREGKP